MTGGHRQGRTSADEAIDAGIARDLSELARRMQSETDSSILLQLIVDAAVHEVDAAEHAGISYVTEKGITTPARTSELVSRIDAMQCEANDGPCLSAVREHVTVRSDDLHAEARWPRFAEAAGQFGIRSMLSVQLFVEDDNVGALTLYAAEPARFTSADENVALLLAAHAAVAIVDTRKISNLQVALGSRDVIGQAKGILMERFKVSDTDAFAMLVAVSQYKHVKLNVICEQLANTGELPDLGT